MASNNNKCQVCQKTVYPVEQIKIDDIVLHKSCLRCQHCKSILTLGKYAALEGKYYCKPHFKQLFALKGNYSEGFQESAISSSPTSASESEHHTEPPASINKLTSEHHEEEEYVPPKHDQEEANEIQGKSNDLFIEEKKPEPPRSYSVSQANNKSSHDVRATKSTEKLNQIVNNQSKHCNSCQKTVYPLEQVQVETVLFHKSCFRCQHCKSVLTLGKYAALEGKYYCKPHFKQLFALKGNYSEGFGTRPHKEKWEPKMLSQENLQDTQQKA